MIVAGRQGGDGDVYDVVDTPFGVRLLIADAKGKDQQAALTAATVLRSFRDLAPHEAGLAGMAQRIHAVLAYQQEVSSEEFATALLMTIREDDGEVEVVCCGHPPPLLLRGRQVSVVDVLPVSPPLGLMDLSEDWCGSMTVPLSDGDQLLLYTDGVSEARDARGQFYPLPERVAALQREDPSAMVDILADDLYQYSAGKLTDPATMLLVRYDRFDVFAALQESVGEEMDRWSWRSLPLADPRVR